METIHIEVNSHGSYHKLTLTVFVAAGVVEMTDDPEIGGPLPTVLRDVQEDDLGTGWAGGVGP